MSNRFQTIPRYTHFCSCYSSKLKLYMFTNALTFGCKKCPDYTFLNKGHWEITVHEFESKRTGERGAEMRYPATASELSSSSGNATWAKRGCRSVPTPIILHLIHCLALFRGTFHSSLPGFPSLFFYKRLLEVEQGTVTKEGLSRKAPFH